MDRWILENIYISTSPLPLSPFSFLLYSTLFSTLFLGSKREREVIIAKQAPTNQLTNQLINKTNHSIYLHCIPVIYLCICYLSIVYSAHSLPFIITSQVESSRVEHGNAVFHNFIDFFDFFFICLFI